MDTNEVVVEYRGYLIIQRIYSGTGTDRIVRPDGTWRESEPTEVEYGASIGWVVAQRTANGVVEEPVSFETYDRARHSIDTRLTGQT